MAVVVEGSWLGIDWEAVNAIATLGAFVAAGLAVAIAVRQGRGAERSHREQIQVLRDQAKDGLRPNPDLVRIVGEPPSSIIEVAGTRVALGLRNVGVGPLLHASVDLWILPLDRGLWDFEAIQGTPPNFRATFPVIAVGESSAPNVGWRGDDGAAQAGVPHPIYWRAHFRDTFNRDLAFDSVWTGY